MTMFTDFMLDLETLSVAPNAAIMSMALVGFNRRDLETTEYYVTCEPDLRRYSVDYSTVKFWLEQSDEARKALLAPPIQLVRALNGLSGFYNDYAAEGARVWALPISFDLPIIENAFRTEDLSAGKAPWKYDAGRDLRTILDLANIAKAERVKPTLAHDALSDCHAQIATLRIALAKLGLGLLF